MVRLRISRQTLAGNMETTTDAAKASSGARASLLARIFRWWLGLVKHMLPPTIFFFVGFNLILLTMQLALAEHGIDARGFFTATFAALLVGKAVLVMDKTPFMSRFDGSPLIQPVLFKSLVYWACVLVARLAELSIHFAVEHGTLDGFGAYLVEQFRWRRFIAIQVWLMVLFMLYVAIHELNTLFGDGELHRLTFHWASSHAKLQRRRRIRLLTRLNRLTQTNSIADIREPGSPANDELANILGELMRSPDPGAGKGRPIAGPPQNRQKR